MWRRIPTMAVAAWLTTAGLAPASEIPVAAGSDVQAAVDRAAPSDLVRLGAGVHGGPVRVDRTLVLQGEPGAILQGPGKGSVVTVAAPDAVVRGLTIRGSGMDLEAMDAGVFVERSAARAVVEGNRIEGNLYGVYLHGAAGAVARGNRIIGLRTGRLNEAGNGISVWNAPGAMVLDNDVRFGRDGIFVVASRDNVFYGNRFRDLRFAVHYMYTNGGEVSGNVSLANHVGYALMYSHRLKVRDNLSDGDRDRAFLFNYANGSEITGNRAIARLLPPGRWVRSGLRVADAEHRVPDPDAHRDADRDRELEAQPDALRLGPEKCVFIYNANTNRFRGNWFEGCEIGVHFTAGSERNEITGNAFVGNRTQVKYVGTRFLDWSKDGRGNYWSDNTAFDLNADGIADTPYRPNDVVDTVLWTAPRAKVLVNSPAVQVLRWAQSRFPALYPGGVVDTHPLMAPPARAAAPEAGGS